MRSTFLEKHVIKLIEMNRVYFVVISGIDFRTYPFKHSPGQARRESELCCSFMSWEDDDLILLTEHDEVSLGLRLHQPDNGSNHTSELTINRPTSSRTLELPCRAGEPTDGGSFWSVLIIVSCVTGFEFTHGGRASSSRSRWRRS